MPDATSDFFESPTENSRIKAKIVAKYAQAWARIMSDYLRSKGRVPQVAYIDLFSGPGTYDDGTPSTPTILLAAVTRDPKLAPALRMYFNDWNPESINALAFDINEFPGIASLGFSPVLTSDEASLALIDSLGIPNGIPRLYFLDQFGYKHVTLEMIQNLLANWGSECIFFFNYRRIIAAVENPAMVQNVRLLFGSDQAVAALKDALKRVTGAVAREQILLSHFVTALKGAGAKHVQPFSFRVEDHHRATHHLIFVTKHDKGYSLMKDIMAREGTPSDSGIPFMSYIQNQFPQTASLFYTDPIDELGEDLLLKFKGKSLTVDQIFLQHSSGTNYVPANYKSALLRLESGQQVQADPPSDKRPSKAGKQTMAGNTKVTFGGKSQ